MSLDVAYSYCINLTEEEKLEIDKQVRKNRLTVNDDIENYDLIDFNINNL